jgi:hypothetical protein
VIIVADGRVIAVPAITTFYNSVVHLNPVLNADKQQ